MFYKVNSTFEKPIYAIIDNLKTFTGVDNKGVVYKRIWTPDAEKIYSVLPKRVWEDFHLTLLTANCECPPHTDTEIITSINFYIDTGGDARTVFFEPAVDNLKTIQVENQTDGHMYYRDQLKEIGSFQAKDYDIWVLDVKKIHAVEGNVSIRKAITLGTFKHKFEDVVEMIKEMENL